MTNSLQSPLRMRRKKHTYQDDSAFQKMYTKNTACILMESPQRKSRRNFVKYSEFQSFPKYGLQQSSAIADTTASITFSTHRVQCRKRKVDETSTELPILEPPNTFPTPVTDVNGVIVHQSIKRNRSNRPSHNIIDTIPVSILDNSTSLLFPMPGPFLNSEEQQFKLSITHNLNGELKSQEDQAPFNFDDTQGNDLGARKWWYTSHMLHDYEILTKETHAFAFTFILYEYSRLRHKLTQIQTTHKSDSYRYGASNLLNSTSLHSELKFNKAK